MCQQFPHSEQINDEISSVEQDYESEEDSKFALLISQYLDQCQQGAIEPAESYANRFPAYRDRLKKALSAMSIMSKWSNEIVGFKNTQKEPYLSRTLGDYQLLRKVGHGGMGNVYKARQISLNRVVAVKTWSLSLFKEEEQSNQSDSKLTNTPTWELEAHALAQLHHTNIVDIFGVGTENNQPYLVMEYIDGVGINQADWEKCFPGLSKEEAVAQIGLQVAQALAYSHKRGVVHLDIKPSNLLLDDNGVVHISDFGLASLFNQALEIANVPNTNFQSGGTLRYMAPERLINQPLHDNGQKSDQYGLGITLYELITGQAAFISKEETKLTPTEMINRITSGSSPVVSSRSSELNAIINKAMAHNAADRYDSMDAMAHDFRRYLECRPVEAKRASVFRSLWFWSKRQPSAAVSLLAALLLSTGFIVSLFYAYTTSAKNLENEIKLREEIAINLKESQKNLYLAERNFNLANSVIDYVLYEGLYPQCRFLYELKTGKTCPPSNQTNLKLIHKLGWYYYALAPKNEIDIPNCMNIKYSPESLNELIIKLDKMNLSDPKTVIIGNLQMEYSMSEENIDKSIDSIRKARKEHAEKHPELIHQTDSQP